MTLEELKERAVEIVEHNNYLINGVLNNLYALKQKLLVEEPSLKEDIEEQFKRAILDILREKLSQETGEDPEKLIMATEDLDYNALASYRKEV